MMPLMEEIRRILITGDTHGKSEWVRRHVFPQARQHDCQLILQVGDFGIWPGFGGQIFLNAVNAAAEESDIPVWFIDGNHEDFDQLYALPLQAEGTRRVRDYITHLPRGYRWTWGGKTFLAAGGATSLDVGNRIEGRSWWRQEAITSADVEACVKGGPADVLVSHDVQTEVPMKGGFDMRFLPEWVVNSANQNRMALQIITDAVCPELQIHGHWHEAHDSWVTRQHDGGTMRVVGLTCDDDTGPGEHHCAVLDISTLARDVASAVRVVD